jgi:nuclear transport factor 2 (NTF2) superfamily protein
MAMQHLPIPPFTHVTALDKVQATEDAWTTLDPEKIVLLCSPDCIWRSGGDSFQGRAAIRYFLKSKWAPATQYQLITELWAFNGNRLSVRFECERKLTSSGQWYRSHGNEYWEFDSDGYMTQRDMSANDIPISSDQRRLRPTNP